MNNFGFSPLISLIVIVVLVMWGRSVSARVRALEMQVHRLSMGGSGADRDPEPQPETEEPVSPETMQQGPETAETVFPLDEAAHETPEPESAADIAPPVAARAPRNWERLIGVTLPVWLGAIALALAGFFFVRYAIESGMITPALRAIACAAAAVGLLAGAELVRRRPIANGEAIASALAAAAIATAYAAVYLASVVYALMPQGAGFILMLVVTLGAIALSTIYGQLVAIIGVIGGNLTPIFYASDNPSALPLFAYLTALLVAGFGIIRLRNWWMLTLPVLAGPALWLLIWAQQQAVLSSDPVPPSGFAILVAIIALAAAYPRWRLDAAPARLFGGQGKLTPELSIALAVITANAGLVALLGGSDFDFAYWQALGVLSVLLVGLGFAFQALRYLKLYPMVAVGLMLPAWPGEGAAVTMVIALFAVLFGFGALDQFRRLREPVRWAGVLALVAAYFFAAALFKATGWDAALAGKHLWALAALALAGAFIALMATLSRRIDVSAQRDRVDAIFAAAASAFISMAVVLELDPVLFPAAAALQVLGLVAIHRSIKVPGLIKVAMAYAGIYLCLLLGAGSGVGSGYMGAVLAKSIADAPFVLLILPGAAFFLAATLLRATPPAWFASLLDALCIVLLALGIMFLAVRGQGGYSDTDSYRQLARVLTPELLLALAGLIVGQAMARTALWRASASLAGAGALALVGLGLAPLLDPWPLLALGGVGPFNLAALAIGLPSLLLAAVAMRMRLRDTAGARHASSILGIVAVLGLFALVMINIRHAFHPEMMQGEMSAPEYYAYSIGMLGFGLALLVGGVALKNLNARVLSLVFVLAATVKVFLFDAAELEGLWRVASFLGMGLAFLGISWFYARFVFGLTGRRAPPAAA